MNTDKLRNYGWAMLIVGTVAGAMVAFEPDTLASYPQARSMLAVYASVQVAVALAVIAFAQASE